MDILPIPAMARPDAATAAHGAAAPAPRPVRIERYHQILLWPVQLVPRDGDGQRHPRPWRLLGEDSPWREVVDEVVSGAAPLSERHYAEFVTFLPYVQRFLYGEGRRGPGDRADDAVGSPMKVFRRHDVRRLRATIRPGQPPVELDVLHVDLYFFHDLDVVLLNVEVVGAGLELPVAEELMHRFGRAYPAGWTADGRAQHCLARAQWLDADGRVLAESDADDRGAFLAHAACHRAPRLTAHWAWLIEPLVADHSTAPGALRVRQIEYHRMPTMVYLAADDPRRISRADWVRLGLVTGATDEGLDVAGGGADESAGAAGESDAGGGPGVGEGAMAAVATLPYADTHLQDFESRFCYDRFWSGRGAAPHTRYLCNGPALVVVGRADSPFFACRDRGVLAQFRHQHFLLFLIAHVQRASLLMFSDRLVDALKRLDVQDAESIKRFKRSIRAAFEGFLRFTHRYWFHEISGQAQVRALFRMTAERLELDPLYAEVKERIADMNDYLETDSVRRQANTVVRLTVVTILGLIGTITTGFLGMNLIAAADEPTWRRLLAFGAVFGATIALTVFTIARSKRLSDFLDALSDERLGVREKLRALAAVFVRGGH